MIFLWGKRIKFDWYYKHLINFRGGNIYANKSKYIAIKFPHSFSNILAYSDPKSFERRDFEEVFL